MGKSTKVKRLKKIDEEYRDSTIANEYLDKKKFLPEHELFTIMNDESHQQEIKKKEQFVNADINTSKPLTWKERQLLKLQNKKVSKTEEAIVNKKLDHKAEKSVNSAKNPQQQNTQVEESEVAVLLKTLSDVDKVPTWSKSKEIVAEQESKINEIVADLDPVDRPVIAGKGLAKLHSKAVQKYSAKAPSISTPHPSESYNPKLEEFVEGKKLLDLVKQKRQAKLQVKLRGSTLQDNSIKSLKRSRTSDDDDDDDDDDDSDSSVEQEGFKQNKVSINNLKTKQDRKKELNKLKHELAKNKKALKEKAKKESNSIPEIAKQIEEEEKIRLVNIAERKRKRVEKEMKQRLIPKINGRPIERPIQEAILPADKLPENLRKLPAHKTQDLLRERYESLHSRNLMEIGNPRKRKLKRAKVRVLKDKFDVMNRKVDDDDL